MGVPTPQALLRVMLAPPASAPVTTPTFVQGKACPNSGALPGSPASSTPDYYCTLAQPAQAGNAIIASVFLDYTSSPTITATDDKSDTFTLPTGCSVADGNGNKIYTFIATGVAAGAQRVDIHGTSNTGGFWEVHVAEVANVTAVDKCASHAFSGNSTTISAASLTPTQSGDFLWQWAASATVTAAASFTAGSQSNISWAFANTMLRDGAAEQYGVYNSTAAITPAFTSGTSDKYDSTALALTPGVTGSVPSGNRIVNVADANFPASDAGPDVIQFNGSGSQTIVISFFAGANNTISSVTSSPSNAWSNTGAVVSNGSNSQMWYCASPCSVSNSMTITVTDANAQDRTFVIYGISGAMTLGSDSGGQTGNQATKVTSLTTCSSCLTDAGANELVFANFGQNFCTATSMTAPTGSVMDNVYFSGNGLDGPSGTDQNNGAAHFWTTSSSALTFTWGETCASTAQGLWAGRVAFFE